MIPGVKNLEAGQQASYAYEVRYLDKAPPVPSLGWRGDQSTLLVSVRHFREQSV